MKAFWHSQYTVYYVDILLTELLPVPLQALMQETKSQPRTVVQAMSKITYHEHTAGQLYCTLFKHNHSLVHSQYKDMG